MATETGLVNGAGLIVAVSHVFAEGLVCEHLVLMGEALLVASAEIAHLLVVDGAHMAMQVGPAETSEVTFAIGAVVSQEEDGVADNIFARVLDANVIIGTRNVGARKVFETLGSIVGENNIGCGCSAVRTILVLVEGSQAQSANVATDVVAACDGVVDDRVGANMADVCIVVGSIAFMLGLESRDFASSFGAFFGRLGGWSSSCSCSSTSSSFASPSATSSRTIRLTTTTTSSSCSTAAP